MLLVYLIVKENLIIKIQEYFTDSDNYEYTPDEIYTHMDYVNNILTKYNIKHWLMFGTLLGGIRNHDIIDYDYDFDFGCLIEDKNKIMSLNKIIKKDGYEFYLPIDTQGTVYETLQSTKKPLWRVSIKIKYNNIIMGDMYLYREFDDGYMRRFDPSTFTYFTPNCTFPYWFIEKLDKVKIRNKFYPCPRSSHILLEHFYGKTWKTPIKARAQGGEGDKNSDYYGMSNDVKLKFLTDYVISQGSLINPTMRYKIEYVVPHSGIKWIAENEN